MNEDSSTPTLAIRKVVGGVSSFVARVASYFDQKIAGIDNCLSIPPMLVYLEANSYLSLYNSSDKTRTNAGGCWITAIFLGE